MNLNREWKKSGLSAGMFFNIFIHQGKTERKPRNFLELIQNKKRLVKKEKENE